jgi:superfamily I DNA and/or RNA helicase
MPAYCCRFLIAAGDPCQLPPVLCSPAHITAGAAGRGGPGQQQLYGLLRPLYVRLTQLGHQPHLLTHQYRSAPGWR